MAVKFQVSLDDAIDLLNTVLELDCPAMAALIANRVPCNEALAAHPTVQVGKQHGGYWVTALGLLAGLFGIIDEGEYQGFGPITAVFEDEEGAQFKQLVRFERTQRKEREGNA